MFYSVVVNRRQPNLYIIGSGGEIQPSHSLQPRCLFHGTHAARFPPGVPSSRRRCCRGDSTTLASGMIRTDIASSRAHQGQEKMRFPRVCSLCSVCTKTVTCIPAHPMGGSIWQVLLAILWRSSSRLKTAGCRVHRKAAYGRYNSSA